MELLITDDGRVADAPFDEHLLDARRKAFEQLDVLEDLFRSRRSGYFWLAALPKNLL
jgi:hypothetical protein